MIRLTDIENCFEFKEFIEAFNNVVYLLHVTDKSNPINFNKLYSEDKFKFMNYFITTYLFIRPEQTYMFNEYIPEFEKVLSNFLLSHKQYINFENYNPTEPVKKFFNKYLFNKFHLYDKQMFIASLKFYNYTSKELDIILSLNVYNEVNDLKRIWIFITLYQKLTCEFIQKYINVLKEPELAYNITKTENQFYQCNWQVVSTIKKIANNYQQLQLNEDN